MTVARGSMWGFLMFAGTAWLAIAWAVLRLEPTDIASVAGPVILFGAVCELLRALAGTRTWWLNAGLTVLFTATAAVMLTAPDSSFTTPASLIGWYLMVRGAVDVAVGIMTRGSDRVWSLLVTVGVLETALGFFSASSFSRTAELAIVTLGGLGVLRAVADLVTAFRLREVAPSRKDILELPPERAAGVAGYSAGLTDFEDAPARSPARHRARTSASTVTAPGETAKAAKNPAEPVPGNNSAEKGSESFHDQVVRTTADLDVMLAQAGITGTARTASTDMVPRDLPSAPDSPEGVEGLPAGRGREVDRPGGGR
ncbi:DUF308 domain-containing protein [Actinoplanes sp. GCM10030250]|uniref:DUF308 domain-containing protein n=1 Tax=Actinoplanes sp. GCM10030250 TaxID=3273376 RepID=UPI003610BD00